MLICDGIQKGVVDVREEGESYFLSLEVHAFGNVGGDDGGDGRMKEEEGEEEIEEEE